MFIPVVVLVIFISVIGKYYSVHDFSPSLLIISGNAGGISFRSFSNGPFRVSPLCIGTKQRIKKAEMDAFSACMCRRCSSFGISALFIYRSAAPRSVPFRAFPVGVDALSVCGANKWCVVCAMKNAFEIEENEI